MLTFKQYNQEEIDILKREYPVYGVTGVQKFIKRSADSIRHRAKRLGITREENFRLSKIDFNDIMSISTPESAYFLGMIWGDGHISWNTNGRQYNTNLTIKQSDFQDIKNLFTKFHVYKIKKQKKSWKQCILAHIGHKPLALFLKDHDYLNKSKVSPDLIVNKIPNNFHPYFFRGWFDADGYNNSLPKGQYKIVMSGSFQQDWSALENLCKKLNIHYKIDRIRRKNDNKYSVLRFEGYNQVLKFRDFLFPKKDELGLSRKRNNFFNIRLPIRLKSLHK